MSCMRAVAISMLVLVSGLLGQIVGPLIVGALDDVLRSTLGQSAVRYSLLLIPCCTACAALAFWTAGRYFQECKVRAWE